MTRSEHDGELMIIAHALAAPALQAVLDMTPWGGEVMDLTRGSPYSDDDANSTHRVIQTLARSDQLSRELLAQLWVSALGEVPVGWDEESIADGLIVTRRDAGGRVIAHIALLWRDFESGRVTITSADAELARLGLTSYVEAGDE